MEVNCTILVKLRNNDIGEAIAVDLVFQERQDPALDLIGIIAVNQTAVQGPGDEIVELVAQRYITHSGPCTGTGHL